MTTKTEEKVKQVGCTECGSLATGDSGLCWKCEEEAYDKKHGKLLV